MLASNFLLLGDFSILGLSPLLLVIVGAIVLLRGDIVPSVGFRPFAITRGSVESAQLQINAGDIDVTIQALQSQERLIAGQYANLSRPELQVNGTHAILKLDRARTSLLTFADWDLGLATTMPWEIVMSSYLGQIQADFSQLVVQTAQLVTGFSDIHLTTPMELLGEPITVKSILGNIHIMTPVGYAVAITVHQSRFFKVTVDTSRYDQTEDGSCVALNADADLPIVQIVVHGVFGDAYLS